MIVVSDIVWEVDHKWFGVSNQWQTVIGGSCITNDTISAGGHVTELIHNIMHRLRNRDGLSSLDIRWFDHIYKRGLVPPQFAMDHFNFFTDVICDITATPLRCRIFFLTLLLWKVFTSDNYFNLGRTSVNL